MHWSRRLMGTSTGTCLHFPVFPLCHTALKFNISQGVAGSDMHQSKFLCKVEPCLWICPNQVWCTEGAYLSIPLNSSMKNAATYRTAWTHWGKYRAKVINYHASFQIPIAGAPWLFKGISYRSAKWVSGKATSRLGGQQQCWWLHPSTTLQTAETEGAWLGTCHFPLGIWL